MIIIKRNQCTYYVKEESIVVEYNSQFISYNVYALQNRKRFKDFKRELMDSNKYDFGTVHELMALASQYGLKGMVGRKPAIDDLDTYLK